MRWIFSVGVVAAMRGSRAQGFWLAGAAAVALSLAVSGLGAQTAASTVEVRAGDTFSAIAGQYTNGVSGWRKMYRPDLSGLPNPNLILPGMRFEVATDGSGEKYRSEERRVGKECA